MNRTFAALGLSDALLGALQTVGYQTPTPIQAQAIPPLLAGSDLLGLAQTGTGKTAAFGLPLLQRLATGEAAPDARRGRSGPASRGPRALILAPTRELALQIAEELGGLGRYLPLTTAFVFGGAGQRPQVDRLRRGVDVLVATPGRLLDLIGQGHVDLSGVEILVLDEADRLLDMGFIHDVKRIVRSTPRSRQSLLFSATMPGAVGRLAAEILDRPVKVEVSPRAVAVDRIRQRLIRADTAEKRWVLEHLLREDDVSRAIVFTRTRHGADQVVRNLAAAGIEAEALHGDKSQSERQRALKRFKEGSAWVLVATDLAARGLDVQAVSHVISYELPDEPESYVHRIGRTGRAGAGGLAWSLCAPSEADRLRSIERLVGRIPDEAAVALEELAGAAAGRSDGARAAAARGKQRQDARARGGDRGRRKTRSSGRGGRGTARAARDARKEAGAAKGQRRGVRGSRRGADARGGQKHRRMR